MLWVVSSAVFAYLLFLALGSLKSPAAEDDTQMMTDTKTKLHEHEERAPNTGQLYIPGDNRPWRVSFGSGPGASVRGWPSKGGLYTLYPCFTVELDFLGLDRFERADRPQNSSSAEADEEEHCKRMRQLGAKWWPSPDAKAMWHFKNPQAFDDPDRPMTYFGWPAKGGVWVLSTTAAGASQMGAGRIHIAVTMEERCKIMESLGAVYYGNPGDCPLLDLSDEAVSGA